MSAVSFVAERINELDEMAGVAAQRIVRQRLAQPVRAAIVELAAQMRRILDTEGVESFDDEYVDAAVDAFIDELSSIADAAIWPALGIEPPAVPPHEGGA